MINDSCPENLKSIKKKKNVSHYGGSSTKPDHFLHHKQDPQTTTHSRKECDKYSCHVAGLLGTEAWQLTRKSQSFVKL